MPIAPDPFLSRFVYQRRRSVPAACGIPEAGAAGPRPTVSASEILTLALCAQWWGRSERTVVRYARAPWPGVFSAFAPSERL